MKKTNFKSITNLFIFLQEEKCISMKFYLKFKYKKNCFTLIFEKKIIFLNTLKVFPLNIFVQRKITEAEN